MHWVEGSWVKFIAGANKAEVSFTRVTFAKGIIELELGLEMELKLLVGEIKL